MFHGVGGGVLYIYIVYDDDDDVMMILILVFSSLAFQIAFSGNNNILYIVILL